MRTVTVSLVMFPAEVTFYSNCSLDEFFAKTKKSGYDLTEYSTPKFSGDADGLYFGFKDEAGGIIWINGEICISNYGTLVHEITHAVFDIADSLGIKPDCNNNEFFCYAAEFLFDSVLKALT
jgi:hypothetical protein